MEQNLDQIVRDGLQARKGNWQAVAQSSSVSYSWLSKFVNGHIPNPGYATLIRIHAVLLGDETAQPTPAPPKQPTHQALTTAGACIES